MVTFQNSKSAYYEMLQNIYDAIKCIIFETRYSANRFSGCTALKRRARKITAFRKADLLIQASLGILRLGSISRRDRISIMNLSSTTTAITFVAWRRLVFPSDSFFSSPFLHSSPLPLLLSLSFPPSSHTPLRFSPFVHLSVPLSLSLDRLLALFLSLSLSRVFAHSLSVLSPSLSSRRFRGRADPFATKNSATTRMTRRGGGVRVDNNSAQIRVAHSLLLRISTIDRARNQTFRKKMQRYRPRIATTE